MVSTRGSTSRLVSGADVRVEDAKPNGSVTRVFIGPIPTRPLVWVGTR